MRRQRRRQVGDKLEIALEKGQATSVLVGMVVAMGLVFLLGVLFGSRMVRLDEAGTDVPRARTSVASDAPELTFHEALTSRSPESPPAAPGDASPTETGSRGEPREAPESFDERPSTEAGPAAEPEVAGRGDIDASDTPAPVTPKREAASAPPAPAPTPASPREPPRAREDLPVFSVQVASSPEEDDARRLADRLENDGWEVRVVPADIEGRGRWYRVRVGSYDTREQAMRGQASIQDSMGLSGLVVSER